MKLKSISIHGFKSFADRVHIQYHDGITGVIGPNGSGKSNVIDAVRWVMGEQTAKSLRADDPTDIIFAGSQNRKPLSMAEVQLTFTNDGKRCPPEFLHLPEVSIGRRIFRSGDREYFMNGEPCRLKDIVDFLLSIGLGSKSYSIIQQEKRDRIIQADAQGMREILEETAGISIFKTRRKEAEKRLESTETNLRTLGDVEHELVKQSTALREQVEKATQKAELVQELREKETGLLGQRVGFFRKEINRLKMEIATKAREAESKAVTAGEWETRANELQSERMELAQQIKNSEDVYDDKRETLQKYRVREASFVSQAEERVKRRATLSADLTAERESLAREEQRIQGFLAELSSFEKELARIDGEIETLTERKEEIDEELRVERSRGEELRSDVRATEELVARLRTENEAHLRTLEKASLGLGRADEELASTRTRRGAVAADRKDIEEKLSHFSSGLESVASERSRLEGELGELNTASEDATRARDEAKQRHLEVASHAASLAKLVSGGTGLSDGTRALRDTLAAHMQGFLYEKITVHKDDERLLESALPELLEAGVVSDSDALMELLDKAEEMGVTRVGFVARDMLAPLSSAETKLEEQFSAMPGFRNVGRRAVRLEGDDVRALVSRLFIVRDEWLALKAVRLCKEALGATASPFVFVSERGTVFSGVGREISFGEKQGGEGQGLLARKREAAELELEKERLQEELARTEGTLFEIGSRRKALQARVAEIAEQFSREKDEVGRLSTALKGFDIELKHIDETTLRQENARAEHLKEMEEARALFGANQGRIEGFEKELSRLRADLEDYEGTLSEKKEMRDEIQAQAQARQSDRLVADTRQGNARTNYEQGQLHLGRLRTKVDRDLAELAGLEDSLSGATDELAALGREIKGLEADVARLSEVMRELQGREAEADETLRVIENKLKAERDTREAYQKFVAERETHAARYEAVLETALKDAWERYGLHPDSLPKEAEDDPKLVAALERRIREIGTAITEMGAVNERAVDEFRDVEERRIFLVQQKEDIEKSIVDLRTSIGEIEEITKTRFQSIFQEVNGQFQRLFPILFPGGHAELVMQKPDDLLATGVEIQVKLPGKNQQNMNLFSGGEKALTAISLIFALLKTTPAPFCYLDEVDAPLDEANVGRFNAVLEALSGEFQFVVITHNRRTMEVLDQIYGISMPEPGVSKLVSVDLTDQAPHLQKKPKGGEKPGASATP
ncbi:MAG: chromosome segregation protein SMC [Silvanigrellales bacterium]|nr:chromosome segregation protein SMC [Silvanigrellales bacterium]